MDNYLVERETLSKLVDALLSKKYPDQSIESLNNIREENIKKLDDKISVDLFGSFTDAQLAELDRLLDASESDPQVFQDFFKNAGIDLEQRISKSMEEFSKEFLGGENAQPRNGN